MERPTPKYKSKFKANEFTEHGSYWESIYPQLTAEALTQRLGLLTSTKLAPALNMSPYGDPDTIANGIASQLDNTKSNKAMEHGNKYEWLAREWYEETHKVKVQKCNLCVPFWDRRIGSSPDGLVGDDGCIEIKCPDGKMYLQLLNYHYARPKPEGANHIYISHYLQMQLTMKVLGRKWCDYIVMYYPNEEQEDDECYEPMIFEQRIYLDEEYWENNLYPSICEFFKTHLPGYLP